MGRVEIKVPFCLLLFGLANWTCATNDTDNGTFVMKIVNRNNVMEPRTLISNYNHDRKEKWKKAVDVQENDIYNISEQDTYSKDISFPRSLEVIPDILVKIENEKCVQDTTIAMEAMTRHERWTLEMFDAFPKFPVGILAGNHYQLGNFDECVRVIQPPTDDGSERIRGQYCLTDIYFNSGYNEESFSFMNKLRKSGSRYNFNNTIIHWGICLPDSCNNNDSKIFVEEIFKSVMETVQDVEVTIGKNKCHVERSVPLNNLEIVYGCIIGVFIMFIIFATAFHCWTLRRRQNYVAYSVDTVREKSSTLKEVILCFSLIRTIKKFLHTTPSELNLECISGIKFLSMGFIISGHSLIFIAGGPMDNLIFVKEQAPQLQNSIFFNNALLVDTFLIISGFLMCRLLLIELDKRKGKINFLVLYIARYIRLTPSYLVVIGFYCTYLIRVGAGPLWDSRIGLEQERCLKSWWTNLLYINNYVNTDYLCMFQSWYLAVDYHLFIVAPFIIYPLWKWGKVGKTILAVCIVPSIGIPFWLTYQNQLDPTLLAFPPEVEDLSTHPYFVNYYIKTHMRTSSYLIGILFGYIVHRLQASGTKIPPYVIWVGTTISAVAAVLSLFSIVMFFMPDHEKNIMENAIYAPLHRVAWCVAIGWLLVICITENAEILNNFLSWKVFTPLSRLTYCAYLVNGFVEIYHIGTLRQNTYMNVYELCCTILSHLTLTLLIAFVICILFESPIHGLEKILLSKHQTEKKQHINNTSVRPMEER